MKLAWLIPVVFGGLTGLMAAGAKRGAQPLGAARGGAGRADRRHPGPGQAHLTVRNMSTIPNDEIPAIRLQLEQDLKAHGVLASGAEAPTRSA